MIIAANRYPPHPLPSRTRAGIPQRCRRHDKPCNPAKLVSGISTSVGCAVLQGEAIAATHPAFRSRGPFQYPLSSEPGCLVIISHRDKSPTVLASELSRLPQEKWQHKRRAAQETPNSIWNQRIAWGRSVEDEMNNTYSHMACVHCGKGAAPAWPRFRLGRGWLV